MFRKSAPSNRQPKGAENWRAYVIGDVHGRLDLLDQLLAQIHEEIDRRPTRKTVIALVGDLIDRGPQSAEVIERLRTYRRDKVRLVVLLGNHEEVLLRILDGESDLIQKWLSYGGSQCLASYGVDPSSVLEMESEEALAIIRSAIPRAHVRFLNECADTFRFGDYLVVHAGIRPGVEIAQQRQVDLRWIRSPFLEHPGDHGAVIVHGHTITEAAEERANRIAIDTGAYATGRLTALAIEGAERWYLDTVSCKERSCVAAGD